MTASATDWVEPSEEVPQGGLTLEDTLAFARLLKAEGIDLVDCSSGGNDPRQKLPIGAGYQVAFADRIRRETGVPTGAVGMITSPRQADQIIRSGQADVVLLARELLRHFEFAHFFRAYQAQRMAKPSLRRDGEGFIENFLLPGRGHARFLCFNQAFNFSLTSITTASGDWLASITRNRPGSLPARFR